MNKGVLEHLAAFVAIAESGSMTAASSTTGTAQATLSRQLASLEKHLGCRLLNRSTRAISLTQDGEIYSLRSSGDSDSTDSAFLRPVPGSGFD